MQKTRKLLITLMAVFFSLTILANPASAGLKIIKLSYSNPEAIIATLKQLFGNKIKAAAAPSINAIVINCEDPSVLKEIDKLASVLDRRPATLKYSIQRGSDSSQTSTRYSVGRHGKLRREGSNTIEHGTHSVVAVEYRKARLTEDSVRIFNVPTYYGDVNHTVTISHGLMVSGHLTGKYTAQVEVWYSSGKELDSETLLTSISAPIGQWVSIGGANNSSSQKTPSLKLGKNPEIGQTKSGSFINRRYLIKVDLVRY